MKISLKTHILTYLADRYPDWIHKGNIENEATYRWGYLGSNAARECRRLCKAGKIERDLNNKKQVLYRYVQP